MDANKAELFSWILTGLSLLLNLLATRKLLISKRILHSVKLVNIVLIWIIPFIWSLFVLSYSDKPPTKKGKFDSGRYMDTGYPSG